MENKALDDYFGYTEAGSSLEGEVRAGITTVSYTHLTLPTKRIV